MNSSKQYRCYGCGWCCQIDKFSSVGEFNLAKDALLKKGIVLTGTMLPNGMILWPRRCPALVKNKEERERTVRRFSLGEVIQGTINFVHKKKHKRSNKHGNKHG